MLVNYYLEPTGHKLPINYHQYKVHNGDEAGILWVFDKSHPSKDTISFSYRVESYYNRDVTKCDFQLLSCDSDTYTQRWRNNPKDTWKVEVWKRTIPDENATTIINALIDNDCTNKLYGVYLNDVDDRVVILSPRHAIVGQGMYTDDERLQCLHMNGRMMPASYPSKYQFKIGSRLYSVNPNIFVDNRAYFLNGKINIGGVDFDKYYMTRTNGFNCFESYAQNATMIETKQFGDLSYHRFTGENDTLFFRSVINLPMIVSKKLSRLVTLEAAKGQGFVISDYGDIPVRAKKDNSSAVLMMLRDDRGKNYGSGNPVKCLGVEGGWYHVKKEIYGKKPIEGYVERDKAMWIPQYYAIFD